VQVTLPSYLVTGTSKEEGMRACMHASCRPYVSVCELHDRSSSIFLLLASITWGVLGTKEDYLTITGDVVFPVSFVCRQLWEWCSWDLHYHRITGGRAEEISRVYPSLRCVQRGKDSHLPACLIATSVLAMRRGHSPRVAWGRKEHFSMQSTIQFESTIQTKTRSK
jgi:hypothetical protein